MADREKKNSKRRSRAAVALRLHPEHEGAQEMLARGRGRLADQIIELARAHGIPIKEDPDLVEILTRLQIMEELPVEIYILAAEFLGFGFKLNTDWAARGQ
jgi:flagellar biosynthesis protein